MKEEMDKLQAGIRDQCWKKNYKYKREKFISKLNRLSRDVESRLLAFEISPRKSFPFFTTVYVSCGFVIYGLYYVEVCSLIPTLLRILLINRC